MARAGRKRKQGKRTKAGQLSRVGQPRYDKGSEWVQAMRDRFGEHYNSPIGRAFASGLLDDPADETRAKVRFDAARKFASLYRRVMGGDFYRCALNDSPRGQENHTRDAEREADDQAWLLTNMARIDNSGCRPFFDQLTSRAFTDYGPPWLDRLLNCKDPRDRMVLDAAIRGIDAIGPVDRAKLSSRLDDAA